MLSELYHHPFAGPRLLRYRVRPSPAGTPGGARHEVHEVVAERASQEGAAAGRVVHGFGSEDEARRRWNQLRRGLIAQGFRRVA